MTNNAFRVVEETEHFIVIDKSQGINFHTENNSLGVFEQVKQSLNLPELFPVHRLDKVTSGLLVMAKDSETNQSLCEQFFERRIEKFYLAISAKKPTKKQGAIVGDMSPSRRGAFKLTSTFKNPAATQFFSKSINHGRRLFILKPHTGKTHQLRVALKSLGAAILGDPLYSDGNIPSDRTYLHAYALSFELKGKRYSYRELPSEGAFFTDEDFKLSVEEFINPAQLTWPKLKIPGHKENGFDE